MHEVPGVLPYYVRLPLAAFGLGYRSQVLGALDLRPGQRVIDVGFGPGQELPDIEQAVGESGTAVGVDLEHVIASAGATSFSYATAGLWSSFRLPGRARSVDRVLADRVVQHVDDSLNFFSELRRVLRPGGLACITEPDWETLIFDPIDAATNLAFNQFVATSMVRNPTFGRQLPRLAENAGFTVRDVLTVAPVVRDFDLVDRVLKLTLITERAVRTGRIKRAAADNWLASMRKGPFLATGIIFTTVIEA